ncbi:universal stress protein [Lysobacter sp. A3-1-A15]|uniref:universal stress protein n=1 Tax=Novilysobacter viscosus TaxID=3098602 RepID=UPI002ED7F9CE
MTTPLIHAEGRVLAAIDRSTYTESVARHAGWAAARLGASLELLHVLDRHPEAAPVADYSGNLGLGEQESLLDELAQLDERRSALAQEQGRLLLQEARGFAIAMGAATPDIRQRHGGLVDTLTELEPGVRLFVLGKRGGHADFAKGHLGGNLERVVRAVHRPLLVASRAFRPIHRVLVAFDGSATTRKGIEMVAASPLFRGLEVRVLMVGKDDDAARSQLAWATGVLSDAGFDPSIALREGQADTVIADAVREDSIDLLVMGAYGQSRIRRLIVGSTTTTMLRTCAVPVLLLR